MAPRASAFAYHSSTFAGDGASNEIIVPLPNVAGWPGGLSWMTSVTRLHRFEFAWAVATARGDNRVLAVDVDRALKDLPEGSGGAEVVDRVLETAGPIRAPAAARDALVAYMDQRNGGPVPFDLADPDHVDRKVRGLLGLALTLPEAHLG